MEPRRLPHRAFPEAAAATETVTVAEPVTVAVTEPLAAPGDEEDDEDLTPMTDAEYRALRASIRAAVASR